jgi:hypothetical protein
VTAAVKAHEPYGTFSNSAVVSNGVFATEVVFSMFSSWSPFFGDRCNFGPKTMELTIKHGDQVPAPGAKNSPRSERSRRSQ